MVIDAIFKNGVFLPDSPVSFQEGQHVRLNVINSTTPVHEKTRMSHEEAVSLFEEMAAQSNPVTDGFSNRDHDSILYSREANP